MPCPSLFPCFLSISYTDCQKSKEFDNPLRVWGPKIKATDQKRSRKVYLTPLILLKLPVANVWKQWGIWSIRCTGEVLNMFSIFCNFIWPSEMSQAQASLITLANQCVPAIHSLCPCFFLSTLTSLYNIWHVFEFKRPSGGSSFSMLIHPFVFFHLFCISFLIRTVGGPSSLCSPTHTGCSTVASQQNTWMGINLEWTCGCRWGCRKKE